MFSCVELVSIYTLLELEILFDVDKSLFHAFLDSELHDLFVACRSVALDILTSWLDAELPRPFYSRFLFKAVVGRPIVSLDKFEVSAPIMFLESGESASWLFVVEKKLDVYRAIFSLL